MANSVNKITLIGYLGRDPEIKFLQSGTKVASFSIATSESWVDRTTNERRENTQWHRIVVFHETLADYVEKYIKKGSRVYVVGAIQYRKYTDAQGIERSLTEIVIPRYKGDIMILDTRSNKTENSSEEFKSPNETKLDNGDFTTDLDDDIPF